MTAMRTLFNRILAQPSKVPSYVQTFISVMMVVPKVPVSLRSRAQTMRAMPSPNSTATTGRVVCWRFAKTVLPALQAAASAGVALVLHLAVVGASVAEVGSAVGVLEEDLVVAEATAVVLVVLPLQAATMPLMLLRLLHRTLSPTMLLLAVNGARSSTSAT